MKLRIDLVEARWCADDVYWVVVNDERVAGYHSYAQAERMYWMLIEG